MSLIYLVRHGERVEKDYQYHVELTSTGLAQAEELISIFGQLGDNVVIVSSPFVRCLQMIAPYAAAHHKLINIEGGLVEASDPGSLPLEYYTRRSLSYSEVVPYDYNQRYTRYKFEDLKTRAYAVLCHLRDHYPSGTVFVLSTHNPVINAIMAIYGHPNKYTTPHRFGEIIGPFEL